MGRFSLKSIAKTLVSPGSDDVQRITEPDVAWQAWAAEHGFDYQLDGSAFEGGRCFEALPNRPGAGEQCYSVVRGTFRDRPFTYVARKTWHAHGRGGRGGPPGFSGALIIQLPGTPVADLLRLSPADAFKAAGGELPRSGEFEWRPPDLLFGHGHWLDPSIVEGILQNITLQLSVAPPELWQH